MPVGDHDDVEPCGVVVELRALADDVHQRRIEPLHEPLHIVSERAQLHDHATRIDVLVVPDRHQPTPSRPDLGHSNDWRTPP